jgi:hypothetical protein
MLMKTGMTLLLVGAVNAPLQATTVDLDAALTTAIKNRAYALPEPPQLEQAKGLFQETFTRGQPFSELRMKWAGLGFELNEIAGRSEKYWLLRDHPGRQRGGGWYLFREGGSAQVCLQAPHARNDLETGLIALKLFSESGARALACSTITRHTADMAHLENTWFQAFTLAFAQVCPTGLVVQVHGFESSSHGELQADVVASAAQPSPGAWLENFANALSRKASLDVLVYPRDLKSRKLSGTQNAQARALRELSRCQFLHLEMSLRIRKQLRDDKQLRRILTDCLGIERKP